MMKIFILVLCIVVFFIGYRCALYLTLDADTSDSNNNDTMQVIEVMNKSNSDDLMIKTFQRIDIVRVSLTEALKSQGAKVVLAEAFYHIANFDFDGKFYANELHDSSYDVSHHEQKC